MGVMKFLKTDEETLNITMKIVKLSRLSGMFFPSIAYTNKFQNSRVTQVDI